MVQRLSRRHLLGRMVLGGVGTVLLSSGWVACAPAPSATPTPAEKAPAPGKPGEAPTPTPVPVKQVQAAPGQVLIRVMDRADPRYQKFVEEWVRLFEAAHPKIKVQPEPIPADWEQKLTAAMAAGAAPDVAAVFGHWFRTYQQKGQLRELTDYVQRHMKPEEVNDFFKGQWEGMSWQGKQLALPQYINVNVLYYNKNAVAEAGAKIPSNDYNHDEFLQFIIKLHKRSGDRVERWGNYTPWIAAFIRIISYIWGLGGQINDPNDITKFTFTKPETIKAFQWVHDIPWKHKVAPVTSGDMGGLSGSDAFWAGKLSTLFDGTHLFALIPEGLPFEFDVLPPPKGPGGRGQRSSMDGYFIYKGSKHPDEAWQAIYHLTTPYIMRLRAKMAGLPPARKSPISDWVAAYPKYNLKSAAADTMDEARPDPRSLWDKAAETWNALNPIMEELFILNKISVEEAMQKMQAAAEKVQRG